MNPSRLTRPAHAATTLFMEQGAQAAGQGRNVTARARREAAGRLRRAGLVALMAGTLAVSGCISVEAPDKPIVIELNINIKQEVIYRLSADAGNTIETNPEIF